jgi:hypothetical protein
MAIIGCCVTVGALGAATADAAELPTIWDPKMAARTVIPTVKRRASRALTTRRSVRAAGEVRSISFARIVIPHIRKTVV